MANVIMVAIAIVAPSKMSRFRKRGICGNQMCGLCGCFITRSIKSAVIVIRIAIISGIALIFVASESAKNTPVSSEFLKDGFS